jgi:serine/threonine protein kinase
MIPFPCSGCGRTLKAPNGLSGQRVLCPGCARAVVVPLVPAGAAADSDATIDDLQPLPEPAPERVAAPDPTPATQPPESTAASPTFKFLAPPQGPDELGRLGRYRVLEILGRGGMGIVFLAEDATLKRRLALKVLLPELASQPHARERFDREARAVAALSNDHVISVYDVGEENGTPFMAMQLLQGESLDARLQREGPLPAAEAVRIGREVAAGLAAAHDARMIHRDVKPSNIWLEAPTGRVKLLDFGLARGAGDPRLTHSGILVGTPAYMAPEQVGNGAVDHRADLFALGCVLYEMLTGRRPFEGGDTLSVLASLAMTRPPLPHLLNRAAPARLSALVMWLLAKKPEGRPSSTAEVLKRLRTLEEEAARPAPPQEPVTVLPSDGPLDVLPASDDVKGKTTVGPWWTEAVPLAERPLTDPPAWPPGPPRGRGRARGEKPATARPAGESWLWLWSALFAVLLVGLGAAFLVFWRLGGLRGE